MAVRDTLPVRLNGVGYPIDWSQFTRRLASDFRSESDAASRIGEQSHSADLIWKRIFDTFEMGAGQRVADLRDSDPRRYSESLGFDPFDEVGKLKLCPDGTDRKRLALGNCGSADVQIAQTEGDNFYLWVNGLIQRSTDLDPSNVSAATFATVTDYSGSVLLTQTTRAVAIVVGNSGALTADDTLIQSFYTARFDTVTIFDDSAAEGSISASTYDLIVICDSAAAATVTTKWKSFAGSVLILEPDLWDDHELIANPADITTVAAESIFVDSPPNFITLTQGGYYALTTRGTVNTSGVVPAGVLPEDSFPFLYLGTSFVPPTISNLIGWAISVGDLRADLTAAPGRRAALGYVEGFLASTTTDEAWKVLENVSDWLVPPAIFGFSQRVTSDDMHVWAAVDSSIREITNADDIQLSKYDATMVGYANGRLIAGSYNELVEIDGGGNPIPIYTHNNPHFQWLGTCAAPTGIFVWGTAGERTEIFFVGVTSGAAGELAPPVPAAPLPTSEFLVDMIHYTGVMFLATTAGIRLGQISGGNTILYGPAIELRSGSQEQFALDPTVPSRGLVGLREDVYFGWPGFVFDANTYQGIGRLHLGELLQPFVPPMASDTMALADSTIASFFAGHTNPNVKDVTVFGGSVVFVVGTDGTGGSDNGVYVLGSYRGTREGTAAFVPTKFAKYRSGWVRFGTLDNKRAMFTELLCQPIAGTNSEIDLILRHINDAGAVVSQTLDTGVVGDTFLSGTPTTATLEREFEIEISAENPNVNPSGIAILAATLYATPVAFQAELITLPLLWKEDVEDDSYGRDIPLAIWPEYQALVSLRTNRTPVTLVIGSESLRVIVVNVMAPETGIEGMNVGNTHYVGLTVVQCLTMPGT